jgi:cation-transporting ATPase E
MQTPTPAPPSPDDGSSGGLSSAEVAERRARGQVNQVPRETSRSTWAIVRANALGVFNLAVVVLALCLLGLYAYAGDRRTLYDGVAISIVALLNTLIGIVQELRARRALERVAALARSTAAAVRDGKEQVIAVDDVVVGDHLILRRGDQVPVDGRLLHSHHCELDESLLTGESEYVAKEAGAPVLSGSFCVAGQARMVAERVGTAAYARTLESQARSYKAHLTPLQRQIDGIVQLFMVVALTMGLLVIAARVVQYRLDAAGANRLLLIIETTRQVASLVTSMIPAGLILLSTVAFALGVYRISRRGALVQKLNAIESFASVDVLCLDKTGTLTRNQLHVVEVVPVAGDITAADLARQLGEFARASSDKNATILALERAFGGPAATGEAAALADEVPFSSHQKFSALRHRPDSGGLVLGGLEPLAALLAEPEVANAAGLIAARPGQRHLVLAAVHVEHALVRLREVLQRPRPLRLLGLVCLDDQLRPDIALVLDRFRARGIALKLVSGDGPDTVAHVGQSSGLCQAGTRVVTGAELDAMAEEELHRTAREASLFARVSPRNKHQLVSALQAQGRYVAMVGDGVNDVLALKRAELGVAMGAGHRMSRDVSDLVLLGDDFTVLPDVIDEGKSILGNVGRAARLFLTKNMYAVLLVLLTGFLGLGFPFVPRHVTIIGVFGISLPALLITFTQRAQGQARGFVRQVLWDTSRAGAVIALGGLIVLYLARVVWGLGIEEARTGLLSLIVLLSLWNFVLIAAPRRRRGLLYGFAAVAGAVYFTLLLGSTRVAGFRFFSRFFEITLPSAPLIGAVAVLTLLCGMGLAAVYRRESAGDRGDPEAGARAEAEPSPAARSQLAVSP